MRFSVFQVSRQGGRKKNEDRMGYSYTSDSVLLMLADGMGGHPDGEVAAALAMETVARLFQTMARPQLDDVADFLAQALMAAHEQLLQYAADRDMMDTPRTTLVMAVIQSGQVRWTHCGDSRLYLVRGHQLLARTQDHSLLEHQRHQLHDSALAVPAETNRNVLLTCLGSPTRPIFNVTDPLVLMHGDTLMLCSDGLWATLPEQEIVTELSQRPVENAVPDLVDKALRQAGERSDNVTCLALTWLTPDTPIHPNPYNP
ncbi:MAG: serine/threonine-protein phosphatase [Rhodoferax sp.]|nr:serine/threonine-protein phosphatase [Rhodoferax sp.]